jgi:hypothetical protein
MAPYFVPRRESTESTQELSFTQGTKGSKVRRRYVVRLTAIQG